MTEINGPETTDPETTDGTTPIEVEPDSDRDTGDWRVLPGAFDSAARYAVLTPAGTTPEATLRATARDRETRTPLADWKATQQRDGGALHVITAAARTPAVGLVAAHEGADVSHIHMSPLADGMAIRVVTRLDRHEVAIPGATVFGLSKTATLRYLPAAAVTNPRCSLGVVLPDDWNSMTGAVAGYSANGLEWEVQALETLGFKIRHRLYVHASPSTMAVHFGTLAERCDLRPIARDILRAGGTVQIEAGAVTPLDAVAAAGIPPWAGWVNRFDMTIVVPCDRGTWDTAGVGRIGDAATDVAALASEAVRAAGGPATAQFGTTLGVALVDAHKLVPGIAGWTTMMMDDEASASEPAGELGTLINAVQVACDGEVDVELVGTGPDTIIDLR